MRKFFALIIISILIFGCSKSISDGEAVYQVDGEWNGMTSQNLEIFFKIKSHTIDTLGVKFGVSSASCIYEPRNPVIFESIEIVSNHFEVTDSIFSISISGDFTSDNLANGTLIVNHIYCGTLNATWEASEN